MRIAVASLFAAAMVGPVSARAADVVAEVAGTPITREQLEAHVKPQLIAIDSQRYEALREGLDELVSEQLLEKEAAARGITADQVLEQDVKSKLTEPSDTEIQSVYDANKAQLGETPLEQVKPRIVEFLKNQQEATLQQEVLEGLQKKYATRVMLKPPVVEVGEGGRTPKGPADAPITIIEFSDYECPFCKRAEETVKQVLAAYPDKIRIVYRDYPLPFHANARPAAMAAACAEKQGKFWEYHGKLFEASAFNEETYKSIAGTIGLDQAKFDGCLASGETGAIVDKDTADGAAVGVSGTPAFFINGRMISGAQPFEKFKEIIDEELAARGS
jgi:protein-disulfide isomerase